MRWTITAARLVTTLVGTAILVGTAALAACSPAAPEATGPIIGPPLAERATPPAPSAPSAPSVDAVGDADVGDDADVADDAGTDSAGYVPPAGAADRPACTAADLVASLGPVDAGSPWRLLLLTHTGARACRTGGFPSVQYLDSGRRPVGEPATTFGERLPDVVLQPGDTAAADLRLGSPEVHRTDVCVPVGVSMLRVLPPGESDPLLVPVDEVACSGDIGRSLLDVRALQPS